jgi:hypothetical protein
MSATVLAAQNPRRPKPCVYLLHFERRYEHAQHYIGWSAWLSYRLRYHLAGRGAALLRAVCGAGIEVIVARVWAGADRNFERRLHSRRDAAKLCPVCSGRAAHRRAVIITE